MGVKGLTHYVCQSTVASREISLENFSAEYKKQHNRQPLLVFDGESFWHVLHGTLPRIFGGQFIQFRKKAEDFCKRLTAMGFRLAFVFGNSPISAEAKAEERGKQTLLHLTSFYRQLSRKKNTPQINEIWPPCLRNVFPYYLRSVPGITVLQSLMDKDLSIACYAMENKAAAIVSNDSDMLIFAVCPVMTARGLVTSRRRVVIMYPNLFCEDVGLPVERLPLLSVYLGNQETPITTNVVEASDGVIQRKIKSGDRGNVQDAIEYVSTLEAPISIEDLARDIFQEVDEENIDAVRISLGRYILRERDYEFDVRPIYKKVKSSPMVEPLDSPGDYTTPEISLFLEKIKKPVIKCDIILKSKAWRREFNIMHMSWPIPGSGIEDPEGLYCPIFSAHAYLLGKKEHLMVVPRFESDPIKLAEPAFRNIVLETKQLKLPDGSDMPNAHELWISQDKRLQITVLVSIWEATELDFQTLMSMVPATLCFLLVLHWVRRKTNMEDWEVLAFLATHVRMRHFTCDQIWRMNDMTIAKGLTSRSVVLANVFAKLMGRYLWMISLCGAPFKTVDLLPDLMFDGMIFQKKYEQARLRSEDQECKMDDLLDSICNQLVGQFDSRKDRDRVNKLFAILNGHKVQISNDDGSDRCRPIPQLSITNDHEPNWFSDWASNTSSKPVRRKSTSRYQKTARSSKPQQRSSSGSRQSSRAPPSSRSNRIIPMGRQAPDRKSHDRYGYSDRSSGYGGSSGFGSGSGPLRHKSGSQSDNYGGYQESNHYTDDQGYNTAATSQSRSISQNSAMQVKPIKGNCEDNHVLSFSDALASKCNDLSCSDDREDQHQSYRHSRGLHFQDDDGWGEEAPHKERKDRGSWEDVWEEAPPPPSRRQNATTAIKKLIDVPEAPAPEKAKANEWPNHDKDSDSWRDVDNEKLNFFSNPGWPNSQADESDLGAGEWSSAGADHEDSKSVQNVSAATSEISYAQAAGAKQNVVEQAKSSTFGSTPGLPQSEDWVNQFQRSLHVREFVPQSRTTSRSPSESTPSEYDGYQSDNIFVRQLPRNNIRTGFALAGYHFPRYPVGSRISKKAHAENNNDGNGNDIDGQCMGMQHSSYHPIPMTVMMAPVMMTPIPYNNLQQMPQSNNM